ncbi:hypothetical protein EJV47_21815 [Hymenobacter gummosus]|uniref:Uncharacterized protein n=1 Tax=Hymenobacter gummosus TaxID=1776032 RepID=A0A431TXW5_9BACT|nr:hypothetical protein [Hymenobacter gummosus]RTQ46588.1 hypothetical protein EJV47_21815 [Hymenobacter gummosus]
MSFSASQPKSYSRYSATVVATSSAPRYCYSSSAAPTGQYHRYRYGRHGRTPRSQEPRSDAAAE